MIKAISSFSPYLHTFLIHCPSSLDFAPDLALGSELAVLPVHHHDILNQRGHALLELLMCRVLADIVVAILGAGKLNHLWPAKKSVQIIWRSSTKSRTQGLGLIQWQKALTKP